MFPPHPVIRINAGLSVIAWVMTWKTIVARKMIYSLTVRLIVQPAATGHTENNKLDLFSFKLASVQVTWLGFPGSKGVKAIDYKLSYILIVVKFGIYPL